MVILVNLRPRIREIRIKRDYIIRKLLLKLKSSLAVVAQDYETQIMDEHVILGNAALFKCSIPSFVADFVSMEAWIDNEATAYYHNSGYGKTPKL